MTTYYTEDHEWITVEGDIATVGITKYAADQLGDVVFVESDGPVPYIASIEELFELDGEPRFSAKWFYRPSDVDAEVLRQQRPHTAPVPTWPAPSRTAAVVRRAPVGAEPSALGSFRQASRSRRA